MRAWRGKENSQMESEDVEGRQPGRVGKCEGERQGQSERVIGAARGEKWCRVVTYFGRLRGEMKKNRLFFYGKTWKGLFLVGLWGGKIVLTGNEK